MREYVVSALILVCCARATSQTVPAGWKIIKDAKAACQIAVPLEWVPLGETQGAAVFHDSTTAIAVVTSQPSQEFKPLTAGLLKAMGIPKEKVLENGARRIFYQERTSRNSDDPNAFSSSVPTRGGTCSCHVTALPSVAEDIATKIALSLAAVSE